MAILGLQGVRGGVGTTSVTAALAWSLQLLGESVLVIDACADNLLRMSFNVDFTRTEGWARALLDDKDWRDAGLRYTSQLDLLPFGQLTTTERENETAYQRLFSQFTLALQSLKKKKAIISGSAGSAARCRHADPTADCPVRPRALHCERRC